MVLAREYVFLRVIFLGFFFLLLLLFLLLSLIVHLEEFFFLLSIYFFFKSSLFPGLFLILGWGCQRDRVQVGIYLLLDTLLASLPLLVGI